MRACAALTITYWIEYLVTGGFPLESICRARPITHIPEFAFSRTSSIDRLTSRAHTHTHHVEQQVPCGRRICGGSHPTGQCR